jgi:FixJ family two-component response regulator
MPSPDGAGECIGGIIEDISPEIAIYLVKAPGAGDTAVTDGLRRMACRVTTFSTHKELMNVAEVLHPGCVVIDVSSAPPAPETLLRLLGLRPAELQVIVVGACGTQPSDVIDALKAGAADYLVPPFSRDKLADAVNKASQALAFSLPPMTESGAAFRQRLASLPSREREVFLALVGGGTTKCIARKLQLSPRTVEVHRAHLMQRLNLRTLTELLHFAHTAGIKGSP